MVRRLNRRYGIMCFPEPAHDDFLHAHQQRKRNNGIGNGEHNPFMLMLICLHVFEHPHDKQCMTHHGQYKQEDEQTCFNGEKRCTKRFTAATTTAYASPVSTIEPVRQRKEPSCDTVP